MNLKFAKYSGCGNDFILIDNRSKALHFLSPDIIARLCHRHNGIGADGVILLETAQVPHLNFKMRIFNADGSQAEMCGNGIRCLAKYIVDLNLAKGLFKIETMNALIAVDVNKETVSVKMPSPNKFMENILINIDHITYKGHHLDTGVPHFVIFVDENLDNAPLDKAEKIRHHEIFKPQGVNVNFAKILTDRDSKNQIALRTYERGVEKETEACGTGAIATALLASHCYGLTSPITIFTKSNDELLIAFKKASSPSCPTSYREIEMTGPAKKTFEGVIDIQEFVY